MRDFGNLSLLESPVFIQVLRDLVRDERIFVEFYIKIGFYVRTMSMSCSNYVFKLFDLFLIVYSLRWNSLFPTWERFIPNVGTFHSQGGNKF